MNIALLSPNKNAYSETFIQAHKNFLKGRIFYYYSGFLPTQIEGGLLMNSRRIRILDIVKGHFNLNIFSLAELALVNSFKKNKIEVVLAEYGETAQKVIRICEKLDLPLIVHFHGYDASVKKVIKSHNHYKEVFEKAKYVVVVSKKMYEDLLRWGCAKDKLVYSTCGPQEEFFEVQPKFSKQQFISIGRFVNKKAPYYLILSFIKVLEKFAEAQLIMAGNGELLNTCKNLVKYYRIEANVTFVGVINPEQYRRYLEESLAFLQHSVTAEDGDAEGTPVGILEASAAGLPVIATKHGGIPDVVIDGKTGLLVDEHDVEGMAKKMIQLLGNKELAIRMGEDGRRNVQINFSQRKHINVLDELIVKASQ